MGTRFARIALGAAVAAFLLMPAVASARLKAGVATVDATWHVGASAGQYASDGTPIDAASGNFDPTLHSIRRAPSYGVQARLAVRALVVQGPNGRRIAIVKNDQYIPQDLVYRRAAQLLEQQGNCGITAETLTMAVTHDHSSPMYSSTSWGVWTFQDVFDVRMFEYLAQRMYQAVEQACDHLKPVRVGAAVGYFDKTHRHSFGPAVADDGTPAGYPKGNTDHDMTVVRFDDISDPEHPKPLANLVNFSLHGEGLEGNDLISADWVAPLQRMVDRRTGAITVFTQGAVGTSEPERSEWHSPHERLQFSHRDYAQAEYAAHLMADKMVGIWQSIADGNPEEPDRFVPFDTKFRVAMTDRWYPGPWSHPYPGVSNCRTDPALAGDPRLPIVGLPDCEPLGDALGEFSDLTGLPQPPELPIPEIDPGLNTDDFEALGIPVPENYSAPAYTGLEEDIDVHLQAFRLGQILFTVCSCEQWFDQSTNIETRTDRIVGNEYLGYDWGAQCTANNDGTYRPDGSGSGTWTCPDPRNTAVSLPPVSDLLYKRMRAQVNNPANGWNNAENAPYAESEPVDTRAIWGNYTQDDRCGPAPLTPGNRACRPGQRSVSASLGYKLTVPISMANDYNGYIATYREYSRGDHYRKALTGWGPHSSDYMATRLVTMGRQLKNANLVVPRDQMQERFMGLKVLADLAVNDARAQALGTVGGAAIAAFTALLPDDGGNAAPVAQPADTERFGASFFTWNGGSNFTDNPNVTVQREASPGQWETYADQSGEVPVTLDFPSGSDVASYLLGDQEWHWTAHFEAFVSQFDVGQDGLATPAGRYRFVVDGQRRAGGSVVPYHLESQVFRVAPWSGITADDVRVEPSGAVSFKVGPRHTYTVGGAGSQVTELNGGPVVSAEIGPIDYPDSYASPIPFIRNIRDVERDPAAPGDPSRFEWYCFTCSFRPWLDAGDAQSALVTIVHVGGATSVVPATAQAGRWVTAYHLLPGEAAYVEAGDVVDPYGDFNGARSATVAG